MRAHASLIAVCLTGLTFAQDGILGTKHDSLVASSNQGGGIGVMPIVQMVVALGIVMLLLKFALPRMVGKMNKKLTTGATSALNIEESATFTGGTLYIVRARSKTFLLSVSTQGVNCLADITETTPEPKTEPDFEDLIQAAPGDKLPDTAVIEETLERLSRLAG